MKKDKAKRALAGSQRATRRKDKRDSPIANAQERTLRFLLGVSLLIQESLFHDPSIFPKLHGLMVERLEPWAKRKLNRDLARLRRHVVGGKAVALLELQPKSGLRLWSGEKQRAGPA